MYIVEGTACVGDGERYEFMCAETARLFAGILNRNEAMYYAQSGTVTFYGFGQNTACSNTWATVIRSGHRDVVCMRDGIITKLDLPYIVWCWLRTTAPVRAAKALWRGWA